MKIYRKDRNKYCEYCGTNVSTPYKGVHDEIEFINGVPDQCRNNGKLNGDIAYPNLVKLRDQLKENTQLWSTNSILSNHPIGEKII